MTQRTVSLGFARDDGDFQILATLNNNDELVADDQFNQIVASLREQLEDSLVNPREYTVIVCERQDTPDYVTIDDTEVADVTTIEPDIHKVLVAEHSIGIVFGTDDVLSERPDLSEEQAWLVLRQVEECHYVCPEVPCIEETIRGVAAKLYPPDVERDR